jgi:VWFA-related protein
MKIITILFCFAGALLAQPTPVIQTETREVLVDTIVTAKNGAYVSDLTAKDFHLSQDGKEQTIKGFALESASATSQPRSLVLFFDETSMEPRDQLPVRQAASSFIDAEAGPNHRMAVVIFSGSVRIVQSFTDNAGRLKDALNQASFHGLAPSAADSDRSHDPSRIEEDRLSGPGRVSGNAAANSFGVRNMIRSLGDLGRSLGALPGRKIVILFTGTLPSAADQKSEVRDAVDAANKSGVAFYAVDVRPVFVQTDPGSATLTPQTRLPMQRGGPGGGPQGDSDGFGSPPPDSGSSSQEVLFGLANGTGGLVVRNTTDLLGGLQKIAQEQDQYYALTYVAPESKEGSCHSLRVKVDRKGTAVRSRTSYCTEKPQDLLAGTSTAQDLERRAAGTQAGGIAASIELSYFYISPNVARVNLAMEIPTDALKFENRKGKLHAEIDFLGIASTSTDGGVGARFSDALKFEFDSQAQIDSLKRKPLHYEKEFKIAPGRYNFAIAFGSGGESFGKLEMPLAVDARVSPGDLAISGLALSRETHAAGELGLSDSLIADRTPLIARDVEIVPSGSNQFAKTEAGFYYFEVYAADPATVRVRVRVLDRKTGEPKSDSGFGKLNVQKNGSGAIATASRLPLDMLAPGTYQLEVTAVDSAEKQVQRTADFEIR